LRRRIEILAWALIWSGVLIGGYVGWQLLVTDLINASVQNTAAVELGTEVENADPETEEFDLSDLLGDQTPPGAPERVRLVTEPDPVHGEPVAFIRIPKLDVDEVVFSGDERAVLNKGPGHMVRTPLPGQPGNSVVSGHRTTYGRPFHDLDLLEPGDAIEVESRAGVHRYEVRETLIVQPTDVWVTNERPGGWLTLITCHPRFSARQRLIVFAEMVSGPNYEYISITQAGAGA
jgi:sortase A